MKQKDAARDPRVTSDAVVVSPLRMCLSRCQAFSVISDFFSVSFFFFYIYDVSVNSRD